MLDLVSGIIWLVAGIILGVAGAVIVSMNRRQAQVAMEAQKQRELELLRNQLEEIKVSEVRLRDDVLMVREQKTRLETQLKEFQDQKAQFEELGQRTLKLLKEEMEQKAAKEYQEKQALLDEKISNLLKPLRELIEKNDEKVKEVEKQHTEDTASLKKHIELIVEETGKLVGVKNKLADALSNSKGRGDWGEMELIRLLEESGLQSGIHYEAQKMENGLRPDITIKLSNRRVLYVDAKTIMVNLERLMGSEDAEEKSEERKKHANALEKEILSLSMKAYQTKCPDSIDFVVLYVPRESMLRAALEEKPALMEQAFQRRIILASPLVLMSILKTVAYGWDQAQLSQNAREIHALGKDLHKRAITFLERFEKLGERIEALCSQYDETRVALKGRQGMVPQLRKFEEYGCKSEKSLSLSVVTDNETLADIEESETPMLISS